MHIIYLKNKQQSEGDVKILKSGERFVRRQSRVFDGAGKCIGRQVTRHGPCYEWVREPSASQKVIDAQAGRDAVMSAFLGGPL